MEMEHDDRRKFRRQAVIWDAAMLAQDTTAGCTVLNLSAGGAKIMTDRTDIASSRVTLHIPQRGFFVCEIAWRYGHTMGLRFLEEPASVQRVLAETLPGVSAAP